MVAETKHDRPRTGIGGEFRKLWAASAVSNVGDGVALVAAPLLAASLTRDLTLVAGLSFAQRLPWLLFTLFNGWDLGREALGSCWQPTPLARCSAACWPDG